MPLAVIARFGKLVAAAYHYRGLDKAERLAVWLSRPYLLARYEPFEVTAGEICTVEVAHDVEQLPSKSDTQNDELVPSLNNCFGVKVE